MNHSAVVQTEEVALNKFHAKMVLTAGIGFFTDAYDIFIISVVTAILGPIWHLTTFHVALLNASALIAAAFGAIFFGFFSDRYGRKKLYGYEVLVLFCGAILSAVSTSFVFLLISRVIVGFGIGGDYPSSAVVISENSTRKNRGFLVLLVFAMQALGLIVGPLLASLLLITPLSHEIIWRVLLGLGAIPAASVFYLRRNIQESAHYLRSKEPIEAIPVEVSRVVRDLAVPKEGVSAYDPQFKKHALFSKKWLICLFGTAGAWFLLDVAFYGNSVSSLMIINAIHPNASLLLHTVITGILFLIFAVPGYALAAKYVDKVGRKPLQYLGFFMMALMFGLMAWIPKVDHIVPLFIAIFGVSFFFVNFGPNTTTFLIPSEIYPTSIRARAHGISAAIGKLGAFVGVFLVPFLLKDVGVFSTMGFMAVVSFLGIFITIIIPEMKNKSLTDTEL